MLDQIKLKFQTDFKIMLLLSVISILESSAEFRTRCYQTEQLWYFDKIF